MGVGKDIWLSMLGIPEERPRVGAPLEQIGTIDGLIRFQEIWKG